MVDTLVSGASASRRVGSTPIIRTLDGRGRIFGFFLFFIMAGCENGEDLIPLRNI